MRIAVLVAAALVASGCTAVNRATVSADPGGRGIFVTEQDLTEPYQSLGPIQATRRGVLLFGFGDPAGTDIQSAVDTLVPEVLRLGGDGVINVRFEQTQYILPTRILFAVLFFIPLPSQVNITGEVVKLRRGAVSAAGPGVLR